MTEFCIDDILSLKHDVKNSNDIIHELDKRLAVTESNYDRITVGLEKLSNKVDELKDVCIEKRVQKQWSEKIKRILYNGCMLILGFIGIYDILFKLFGIK